MNRLESPLTPQQAEGIGRIADAMLPASGSMPSAGEARAVETRLGGVLESRPDLLEDLIRALDALDAETFTLDDLPRLHQVDEAAYVALTTVVAACYYQSPVVRERIGYPGQVAKTYDPYAYVEWVGEGLLDPVIARGPIWRDPATSEKVHGEGRR